MPRDAVLARLHALLGTRAPADVAVLARVGATLLAPQLALRADGVPLHPAVGPDVLLRPGVRTALAYLRIATRPDHIAPEDLADVLRRPARRLHGVIPTRGTTSLARLARVATGADGEHRAAARHLVADLARLAGLARDGADSVRLLTAIRDDVGLGASLDALDGRRVRPEGSSHGDDLEALRELATLRPDPSDLPGWLAEQLRPATVPVEDAVTFSTVHRVKGREWDTVVLVGLQAGLVPHRLCDDTEEERRVLHVALTRARRHLLLGVDPDRPSPFLPELLGTLRPAGTVTPDDVRLRATLRDWRRARAAADDVPAFLIAHDRTLNDLVRRRPCDRVALLACYGIGPTKADRYGDELLALLARSGPGPTLAVGSDPQRT